MTITVTVKRTGKVVAVFTVVAPQTCLLAVEKLKALYPRHNIRLTL